MGLFGINTSYNTGEKRTDPLNNPKRVVLNGVELPLDVITLIDGKKVISETQILDGQSVFERIARRNYEVQFQFTIRDFKQFANLINDRKYSGYAFPQTTIDNIFQQVFEPNKSLTVDSTLLNHLGISRVVIFDISLDTVRGNTNVPVTIKCKEDYVYTTAEGQSLIMQ